MIKADEARKITDEFYFDIGNSDIIKTIETNIISRSKDGHKSVVIPSNLYEIQQDMDKFKAIKEYLKESGYEVRTVPSVENNGREELKISWI